MLFSFVYQCNNIGKDVCLITKHEHDLEDTLKRYNIQKSLFSEIILLNHEQNKSDFYKPRRSYFH